MKKLLPMALTALLWCTWPLYSESEEPDAGMVAIDGYLIDVYEYPNIAGAAPKVDITWAQAQSLCQARGKRLCSESEWEEACRGPDNFAYGYGPEFDQNRCNTAYRVGEVWRRDRGTTSSGAFAECTNGYGVYDMIGNVWEWTDGRFNQEQKDWHVVRGGSWFHSVNLARASSRYGHHLDEEYSLDLVGFRCCRSAE
ncbi:MAG: SUMF1/EgtB/PvdO family nonheme iron enzyme [Candidatus Latescibacteria bacterium]|nr:SUMF1/EgtB/PvdO family nonheme iron enzyme [Candidatus Latescibacterota bacterium]